MTPGLSRDEILRRFTEFLDQALSAEQPPTGVDQELLSAFLSENDEGDEGHDSYSLWSSVTALTQEVKLQGRSFKELADAVVAQANAAAPKASADSEQRCRKQALSVYIDIRERLWRGLQSARAPHPRPWYARLFPDHRERLDAIVKGYELAIERVDEALAGMDAREIPCLGRIFDPRTMNAIDREDRSDTAEGTVLEVYLSGYEWNGEIFRPAQVKVAGRATAKDANE